MDLKKLCCCDCAGSYNDYAYTAVRVVLGIIFLFHGYQKVAIMGMAGVSGFLGSLGFPMPDVFAYILSYGEVVAGLMLIAGVYTHWAAKFAVIVGIVAWATVHFANGFDARTGGYEYIMLITFTALYVMTKGAGKYSVDHTYMKHSH